MKRIWLMIFFYLGMIINHKKVHRIMRLHCHPRVEHRKSMAASPNQRWATTSPPWAEVTMAGVPLCRLLIAARVKSSAGNWLTPPVPKLPSVRWRRPCGTASAPPEAFQ
jgi:hypothetical protein